MICIANILLAEYRCLWPCHSDAGQLDSFVLMANYLSPEYLCCCLEGLARPGYRVPLLKLTVSDSCLLSAWYKGVPEAGELYHRPLLSHRSAWLCSGLPVNQIRTPGEIDPVIVFVLAIFCGVVPNWTPSSKPRLFAPGVVWSDLLSTTWLHSVLATSLITIFCLDVVANSEYPAILWAPRKLAFMYQPYMLLVLYSCVSVQYS